MSHTRNGKGLSKFDPATTQRITPLIRAIHAHEPDPIVCTECRHHMADLYHLQRTESELAAEYVHYQEHLNLCPDCNIEFTALGEVLDEFEAGTLPDVALPPAFDLSFMDSATDDSSP
jgi:hypothetical protein